MQQCKKSFGDYVYHLISKGYSVQFVPEHKADGRIRIALSYRGQHRVMVIDKISIACSLLDMEEIMRRALVTMRRDIYERDMLKRKELSANEEKAV